MRSVAGVSLIKLLNGYGVGAARKGKGWKNWTRSLRQGICFGNARRRSGAG
jgi:hypothetical protein